jgi:hypothetical protein
MADGYSTFRTAPWLPEITIGVSRAAHSVGLGYPTFCADASSTPANGFPALPALPNEGSARDVANGQALSGRRVLTFPKTNDP